MRHTLNSIMDHPRTYVEWIVRPAMLCKECGNEVTTQGAVACPHCIATTGLLRNERKPVVVRMAMLCWLPPSPGHGELPLHLAATDWGEQGKTPAQHHIRVAKGFGYDKKTACLEGIVVGGVELGDHCDSQKRPTLDDLCRERGWERVGGCY